MTDSETVRISEQTIERAINALKHALNWSSAPSQINWTEIHDAHAELLKAFRKS